MLKLTANEGGHSLNELIFISERCNTVSAQFIRQGRPCGTVYSWYLPYSIQKFLRVGDVAFVSINKQRQKVRICTLSYQPDAVSRFKEFPYQNGQPSWQIQRICRLLKRLGHHYQREKHFKGLRNSDGISLGVDIAFRVGQRWCLIEYNGAHHYNQSSNRFAQFSANMEAKRVWARNNDAPMLEIPFWWQNSLDEFVLRFLQTSVGMLNTAD